MRGSRSLLAAFALIAAACQNSVPLPPGDLFAPLLADPKEPRFAMSLRTERPDGDDAQTVGIASFGETFGLYRHPNGGNGDGLQLNLAAGIFAQFDMDGYSNGLVNADYQIGLPATWRSGALSARARLYHQSSHLGDEYILKHRLRERENYNYDAVELLIAGDAGGARLYLGGEYLFSREPDELEPWLVHAGVEYRSPEPVLGRARLVAGVDLKSWEENDWKAGVSLVCGVELPSPLAHGRVVRLQAEYYEGFGPYGQFFDVEMRSIGVGLAFSF